MTQNNKKECENCEALSKSSGYPMYCAEHLKESVSHAPKADWEEDFDKEFDKNWPSVRSYTAGKMQEWIISFISQTLERERALIREKLRKGGVSSDCIYQDEIDDILKSHE